jgi:hypothetical protein
MALVLVWLVGLAGWRNGCESIEMLHNPEQVRAAIEQSQDTEMARKQVARIDTLLAYRKLVTPLAVGEFLLGSLLTFAAGTVLWGRRHARGLLLQAILVYAVFLTIDYALRRPVRARDIDLWISDPQLPQLVGQPAAELAAWFRWLFRGLLAAQLAVLGGGLLAMTRPRVRALLGGPARGRAGQEEP